MMSAPQGSLKSWEDITLNVKILDIFHFIIAQQQLPSNNE